MITQSTNPLQSCLLTHLLTTYLRFCSDTELTHCKVAYSLTCLLLTYGFAANRQTRTSPLPWKDTTANSTNTATAITTATATANAIDADAMTQTQRRRRRQRQRQRRRQRRNNAATNTPTQQLTNYATTQQTQRRNDNHKQTKSIEAVYTRTDVVCLYGILYIMLYTPYTPYMLCMLCMLYVLYMLYMLHIHTQVLCTYRHVRVHAHVLRMHSVHGLYLPCRSALTFINSTAFSTMVLSICTQDH